MNSDVIRVEGGELRRIEVRPGDLFVLTAPHRLTAQEAAAIREQWHSLVGADVPLLVLEGGELTVYRPVHAETS